jgi:hypothetical protein
MGLLFDSELRCWVGNDFLLRLLQYYWATLKKNSDFQNRFWAAPEIDSQYISLPEDANGIACTGVTILMYVTSDKAVFRLVPAPPQFNKNIFRFGIRMHIRANARYSAFIYGHVVRSYKSEQKITEITWYVWRIGIAVAILHLVNIVNMSI